MKATTFTKGLVIVYPQDTDGINMESAIVIYRDGGGSVVIQQEEESICLSSSAVPELIAALKQHMKECA